MIHLPMIGEDIAIDIDVELENAAKHESHFNSLHEAWAVILEELDEVWTITKMKKRNRSAGELRKELVQVAAMAIKSIQTLDKYPERFVGGKV